MITKFYRHIAAPAALIIVIFMLFFPLYSLADVYRYVDENQVIHLTNVPVGTKFKVLIREKLSHFLSGPSAPVVDRAPYDALIRETADKHGVDYDLVKAIIKVESNFNHKAVSKKGAKGLMQLMPRTALSLGVTDCFHPQTNIDGGIRHLSYLLGIYSGNLPIVLAAYNAGEGAVAKYGNIPPYAETRAYVRQVLGHYERYRKESGTRPVAVASVDQLQLQDNQRHLF